MQAPADQPLHECSDAMLVEAVASGKGSQGAEAELCRRYQRRVYLYGLRHLRDADEAWDLTQDVLSLLIEKARARELRDLERVGSFVLGSCRMLATNRRRGEGRRRKLLAQYAEPSEASVDPPAERTDLERVSGCFGKLSDREQSVLLLSFYAELDATAIGSELGTSSGNVRVLRHRALERLQACVHAGGGSLQ